MKEVAFASTQLSPRTTRQHSHASGSRRNQPSVGRAETTAMTPLHQFKFRARACDDRAEVQFPQKQSTGATL